MPFGPEIGKKLVVSVSLAQATKLKVSHKQLVEELLPACKQAGATKGSAWENEKGGRWAPKERWEEEKWEGGGGRRRDEDGKSLTSGSAKMRQRLQLLQEQQGMPQTEKEAMVQKLSAMGHSRFKRIEGRKEKREKAEREKQEAFHKGAHWQYQVLQQWPQQWQQQWPQQWPQQWQQQWPQEGQQGWN
eukprot:s2955_g6.t1